MKAQIQARRDALAAEQDAGELAYARLEEELKRQTAHLALMQRQLDLRAGAIQAYDALLALPEAEAHPDPLWPPPPAVPFVAGQRNTLPAEPEADPAP